MLTPSSISSHFFAVCLPVNPVSPIQLELVPKTKLSGEGAVELGTSAPESNPDVVEMWRSLGFSGAFVSETFPASLEGTAITLTQLFHCLMLPLWCLRVSSFPTYKFAIN